MKSPNIVLILTDQMRLDCLGSTGNPVIQTPHIDSLALGGTVFANPYVCLPVCQPNRVSLLTGHYPSAHGTTSNGIKYQERFPILPELLRRAGYQTWTTGKMHFNPIASDFNDPPEEPGEVDCMPYMGFEKVYSVEGSGSDYMMLINKERPDLLEAANHRPGFSPREAFQAFPTPIPLELHRSTKTADHAIEYIKSRDREKPFFMHCSFWDPHHPFDPPAPYDSMYDPEDMPEPIPGNEEYFETMPDHFKEWWNRTWKREGKPFRDHSMEDWKKIRALYYGMISLIDDSVGRILKTLEDEGLKENTVIIFTSDHGEILGDHGLCLKGPFFYESLIKVPFIYANPLERNHVPDIIDKPVMNYDLMPTILELAGAEVPPMTALSLLPLLRGDDSQERPILIEGIDTAVLCYREGPYKITINRDSNRGELYDLEEDPREITNLWDKEQELKCHMLLKLSQARLKQRIPSGERTSLW